MLDLANFNKIKWGPGVVGRTTILTGMAMICTLGVTLVMPFPEAKVVLGSAVVLEFLLGIGLAYTFAFIHPSLSVLEGSEATQYKQAEMAAKGLMIDQIPFEKTQNVTPPASFTKGEH
ncbi:hypothetical protein [Devosia beringensis]|uniref:hypothetical protein n=1 Tax=Devosia beringensis TaxID=2657486 RepID=UPI00186BA5EF|nr:hypothetical protein [Devosia beringensis]